MNRIPLEVCVDTIDGAWTAAQNGADRIELCSALSEGGLTPSLGLMAAAAQLPIPVYAMIRPRGGHFQYSRLEKSLMLQDVQAAEDAGLAGIAIGAVNERHELDQSFLAEAISGTGLNATLHRAVDTVNDFENAIVSAIDLGFERILTSGQSVKADQGLNQLAHAVRRASGRISIMAGSGVTALNAALILKETSVNELHASCSAIEDAPAPESQVAQLGFVSGSGIKKTNNKRVQELRAAMDRYQEAAA
ncbi:Copper homeostasis protein CutC [Roseibium album]|nr:Copper homeostasis protein CutC [Roseibium album]